MPSPIIEIENLGKKYDLRHRASGGVGRGYRRFSEELLDALKRPFRRNAMTSGNGASNEEFWALRNVSFDVQEGEVVGIIGRNGAGKSTLLKLLSRITEPTEGRVRLRGRVASLLEVGTGFHPELTGRENIYLNGAILGMSRAEIKKKFDEIVAFAEVERFLDTPVKRYSSGMYVRLAFAVAAHLEPEILVVDEVLAVGDAQFQKKCLGRMRDVAGHGRTVLFVSHNIGAIADLCSRCICLRQGQICSQGVPQEVIPAYLPQTHDYGSIDLRDWSAERSGDGPMRMTRATIESTTGSPRTRFEYREPIVFRAIISTDQPRRCIVGVSVRSSYGQVVLHLNNADEDRVIQVAPPESAIVCRLDENILNDGQYHVSFWLGDGLNVLHDRVSNCLSFSVFTAQGKSLRCQGSVRPSSFWDSTGANA